MKTITGEDLINLGFKTERVLPKESGQKDSYYYYIYKIGELCLVSNTNDECIGYDEYYVEFFDHQKVGKFYNLKKLCKLIKLLESGIK
jgi:hypothetical protein